jgi:hypothetical protein
MKKLTAKITSAILYLSLILMALPVNALDVRKATPPPRFEVKAPEGAPNVLLVLIDDLGFAGTSAFGGPVATPHLRPHRRRGLKYNNFHTTAVCSPTRTALKAAATTTSTTWAASSKPAPLSPATPARFPKRRPARRDAAPQRLRHRRLRQMA